MSGVNEAHAVGRESLEHVEHLLRDVVVVADEEEVVGLLRPLVEPQMKDGISYFTAIYCNY